ncbi:DUF1765-domain-containing protein [Westerdykella ornata]|uniref:DUF1765-domain-containing protein n=1 Tax=Westerdykella ornata TaxID=318751 RepID=A0A6A6JD15_WESOR|nr:DUF1765-domain-containing protein [Westerdykella ornata]KAF2274124.1 DUF1765-domain-containing protein [Westerdykella ornata]
MQAVAQPIGSHDLLANVHRGTRHRSTSDAFPSAPKDPAATEQLPKAASYTHFPRVKHLDDPSLLSLKARLSEDGLELRNDSGHATPYSSSDGSSPESEDGPRVEQMPQINTSSSRRSSRLFSFSSKTQEQSQDSPRRSRPDARHETETSTSKSPVRSLSKLRRKSWVSSQSRSTSPTKTKDSSNKVEEAAKGVAPAEPSKRRSLTGVLSIPDKSAPKGVAPNDTPDLASGLKGRALTKRTKRPLSGLFSSTGTNQQPLASDPDVPAIPQIPQSFSTEKLPYFAPTPATPTKHIPPIPPNISAEKLKGARTEPRKKDELWTVFRTLEADYRKQSKSIALKANVVRTTLLPFLRSYASHPSNHKLRPEDLDRRANILNGWWTALLELLAGRNNQSVSGTDRPAILEGISGIMERPEWRMSPSPFCALADRSESSSTTTTESGGSNTSLGSDFLAESVYHNVRNIYTQNLLSQLSFVVEKMSLRNAAASLVTFCGKTCAYAFCFCPGIADVLVRLWNPSLDLMKRVLVESGVTRQDQLGAISARVVSSFPPTLHSLKVESLMKTMRLLRQPASPPLGTASLDWYGAWMKRWSGAESDLFYVFVKHYHILVTDFLPVEPSNAERMCVPGLLMVHAQILANLDATINRHAAPQQAEEPMMGPSSITFDDVLSDPDASASTLPIPPANATRQMVENRLIMLIRDFLSDRNAHLSTARRVFADGFVCLLKAAAKKVSIYDNNACYTLCDFLEEAFAILVRYEQSDPNGHSVLDWDFWLSVCKQMTASLNTATEIKLYAFLYSTWSLVTADERRKTSLCMDFLLEPDFFQSRFNHWCPMVRSYYMRLMCWRVARFDGEDSDTETNIMKALSDRLRSVWAHYLWLREEAELRNGLLPSTQACNPAPGRRFLIIRNDNPVVTHGGPFIFFDGVVQNPNSRRLSDATALPEVIPRPDSAQSEDSDFGEKEAPKGRWSLLRSFMGASPKQPAKPKSAASTRAETKTPGSSPASGRDKSPASKDASPEAPASVPTHRTFSFRFSLEWVDKRFGAYQPMRLSPPRLPLPAQVHLQNKGINITAVQSAKPTGAAVASSRYAGRALAEWTFIFHECQNFFDRRKNEGVPSDRYVETPTLAVEAFRRPG